MSEELAVRGSDLVMRELAQAKASVIEAQRVLVVGAGSIPKLLGELNASLADLGYVCVPIEPAQGLYKTFADLLACPSLAPLLSEVEVLGSDPAVELAPDTPRALEDSTLIDAELDESNLVARQIIALEQSLGQSSNHPPAVPKLDMAKPINWKLGDIFIDNPRFTLQHKQRKWVLDSLDVSDLANLSGMDVEIRSPNTTTTELLTLKQFMAQYVFHSRPDAEQSAAE